MNEPPPTDDHLLTPSAVAWLFGVHTRTVNQWARDGLLTPVRTPGGHRRFRSSEVHTLLSRGTDPGDAGAGAGQVAIHLDADHPVLHTLTPSMVAALDQPGAIGVDVAPGAEAVLVHLPWLTLAWSARPAEGHTGEDVARRLGAAFHIVATLLGDTALRRQHARAHPPRGRE